MASGSGDHVIDIIIEASDQTGGALNRVRDNLLNFDRSVQRMNERIHRLTNQAHQITLSLIDQVTPQGSHINQWLRRMTDRAHSITLRLADRATDRIRATEARLFQLTAKAYTITVNLKDRATQGLKSIGNNVLQSATGFSGEMIAGAGIGYGIYDTVKTYKDFQQQMSAVGAISGASAAQMEMLTAKALEMGSKTSFSATQAGQAFEYMATAGWKTDQMMSGISGIMNLAAASGEDLGRVSDIVTDALTAFNLTAEDSARFADVLAATAANSNTNVGKMGYTFQYVAPIAGAMGQSIEDVAVATGLMANAGIKGEQSGTSLRYIMTALASEGGQAAKTLADLGVRTTDSTGKMRPFMDIIKEARTAFQGLSDAEKSNAGYSIAGMNALSGWLAMMNASDADLQKLEGSIRDADGAAEEMANRRLDNLAGDLTLLASAWESLQLTMMQGDSSNFLREFVQGVKADVEKFTKYIEDGFDISDVGHIALDILTQLKNKFLEFDGVGSVLAGGALIGGLAKITSKTMKLIDYLKEASHLGNGGSGGIGQGGGGSSQSVGVMNVKANVVNLSGPTGGGPGGTPPAPPPGPGGAGGAGGLSRLARGAKLATRIGGVVTAGLAAYDVYSTSKYNDQMTEEADWRLQEASRQHQEDAKIAMAADNAFQRGDITEEERNQAFARFEKSGAEVDAALDYQKRTEEYNTTRMNTSVGEGIGSVGGFLAGAKAGAAAGGAIGAVFGGIGAAPGAAIGGFIGGVGGAIAGSELGGAIGANWEGIKAEASNTAEWIGNKFSELGATIGEKLSPIKDAAQNEWDYLKNSAADAAQSLGEKWDGLTSYLGENVWTPIKDTGITALNAVVGAGAVAGDMIGEAVAPVANWINENVWTPIKDSASEKWEEIKTAVSEKADAITAAFDDYSAYFNENVWEPIKEGAAEKWAEISEIPGEASAYISELWGGVTGWFDENVWTPIGDTASSAWASVSGTANAAWDAIVAYFEPAASWFDSTVWSPISSAVDGVKSAITGAFEAAWSAVTGIWAAAGSWFESNVIAPVKSAFDKIVQRGASITGLSTSGGSQAEAYGGFVTSPRTILAGEDGGEVVIPLSSNKRSRALSLFERTGEILSSGGGMGGIGGSDMLGSDRDELGGSDMLGSDRDELGNLFRDDIPGYNRINADDTLAVREAKMEAQAQMGMPTGEVSDAPIAAPAQSSADGSSVSVEMGGININLTVSGGDNPQSVADEVMRVFRENMERITDDAGGKMAEKLASIWGNRPVFGA